MRPGVRYNLAFVSPSPQALLPGHFHLLLGRLGRLADPMVVVEMYAGVKSVLLLVESDGHVVTLRVVTYAEEIKVYVLVE